MSNRQSGQTNRELAHLNEWWFNVERCEECGNRVHPLRWSEVNPCTKAQIPFVSVYDPVTCRSISCFEIAAEFDKRSCDLFPAIRRSIYYSWKSTECRSRCPVDWLELILMMQLRPTLVEFHHRQNGSFKDDSNFNDDFDDMAIVDSLHLHGKGLELWRNRQRTYHRFHGKKTGPKYTQVTRRHAWARGCFVDLPTKEDHDGRRILGIAPRNMLIEKSLFVFDMFRPHQEGRWFGDYSALKRQSQSGAGSDSVFASRIKLEKRNRNSNLKAIADYFESGESIASKANGDESDREQEESEEESDSEQERIVVHLYQESDGDDGSGDDGSDDSIVKVNCRKQRQRNVFPDDDEASSHGDTEGGDVTDENEF